MEHPKRRLTLALGVAVLVVLALVGVAAAATLPSTPASTHVAPAAVDAAAGATQNAQDALDQHASGPSADEDTQEGTETENGEPSTASDHGSTVAAAAQSDTVGGAHQNHGGYVSCVARGGSNCTSTTPTLPQHGVAPANPQPVTQASQH